MKDRLRIKINKKKNVWYDLLKNSGQFREDQLRNKKQKGKCTPCISRGTISRSSLESRIRFLPSSMLAILALWSPPGTAVAGTPDTPLANAPIPATFVGIVAVCFFLFLHVFFFFYIFRISVQYIPVSIHVSFVYFVAPSWSPYAVFVETQSCVCQSFCSF